MESTKFSHTHLPKKSTFTNIFQLAKFGIVFNANSNDINVSVNKKAKKGYFVFNNIFLPGDTSADAFAISLSFPFFEKT